MSTAATAAVLIRREQKRGERRTGGIDLTFSGTEQPRPPSLFLFLSLSLSLCRILPSSSHPLFRPLPSSSVLFRPLIPPTSSISTGNCFPFHCPARMLLSHSRIPSRSLSLSFSLAISPWLFNAPFLRASSTTSWEKARRKGREDNSFERREEIGGKGRLFRERSALLSRSRSVLSRFSLLLSS